MELIKQKYGITDAYKNIKKIKEERFNDNDCQLKLSIIVNSMEYW